MSTFYFRTESIRSDKILELSILNANDRKTVDILKSEEPTLLEGSRGTGKSFLMRVAELELEKNNQDILPVYSTFNISSLINTADPLQFYHWMLAKTLKALISKLRKKGISLSSNISNLLSSENYGIIEQTEKNLKDIVHLYEHSFDVDSDIDIKSLPDVEEVKDAIENLCDEQGYSRVCFFFDEATHVFRPEQQRQFFNLFKDLRSPYITCNAAIYPGVTYFGSSFEITHDCNYQRIDRQIKDKDYLENLSSMVLNQIDDDLKKNIEEQKNLFHLLVYSCSGNPRLLMRTLEMSGKLKTNTVEKVLKDFYRTQIWKEHTELGDKYSGHKVLVDWGRKFVEDTVIPSIIARNKEKTKESIIYFWIDKDAPKTVQEALRLLTYTGIIRKYDSGVKASESKLGTRYELKYGCILAHEASPSKSYNGILKLLTIKRFISYGKNTPNFEDINNGDLKIESDDAFQKSISKLLEKPIEVLQITKWQKEQISNIGIITISDLYNITEDKLIENIHRFGNIRARQVKNATTAELLEYLSG